ncbi:CynX/NimT family MFS transporter [Thermodesulfobacteriota bacterium]
MDQIRQNTNWGIVAVALAAGIVAALQVGKLPSMLPILRDELKISMVTAGWVASLFNGCAALLGVLIGLVTDRISARSVLFTCTVLLGLGNLIGAMAPSVSVLFTARLIEGVGLVGVVVAAPTIITASSKREDRALTLSIWGIYMPAGMAVAMVFTPFLIPMVGWRGVWLVNFGIIVVLLLVLIRVMASRRWTDSSGGKGQRSWQEVRQTLLMKGPWILGACFTLYALQFFAVMIWLPTYLIETQQRTPESAAFISAAVVFINIFGNLSVAWFIRWGIERWVLAAIAYGVMSVTAVGIFSPLAPDSLKIPLAFMFSAVGGLLPTAILASAPLHSPSQMQVATTNGIIVQGANCGSLVGPPVMAATISLFGGWHNAYLLLLICSFIGLGFVLRLGVIERSMCARPVETSDR